MSIHNNEIINLPERRPDAKPDSCDHGEDLEIGVLDGLVAYQLRRAQMRVYGHFAQRLEHMQITPGQLALLVKIFHNGGISQTALAKANGIERSTLGEIVDRFEKREWVERRKHNSDRRAYALYVTEQGRLFLDSVVPAAVALERELTASWPEKDRARLLELLKALADS
ncbi:MarR family transcriptional regulator [Proteobacteria bacterium 005FR1]|nr:MarR family transcriptional regulator [Proteobacteria bacterium 005FR1]